MAPPVIHVRPVRPRRPSRLRAAPDSDGAPSAGRAISGSLTPVRSHGSPSSGTSRRRLEAADCTDRLPLDDRHLESTRRKATNDNRPSRPVRQRPTVIGDDSDGPGRQPSRRQAGGYEIDSASCDDRQPSLRTNQKRVSRTTRWQHRSACPRFATTGSTDLGSPRRSPRPQDNAQHDGGVRGDARSRTARAGSERRRDLRHLAARSSRSRFCVLGGRAAEELPITKVFHDGTTWTRRRARRTTSASRRSSSST